MLSVLFAVAFGVVALEWAFVLAWVPAAFAVGLRVRYEIVDAPHLRPTFKYPVLMTKAVLNLKRPGLWLFRARTDSLLSRPYLLGPAKGQVRQLPNRHIVIEAHMPATGPFLVVVLTAAELVAFLSLRPGDDGSGLVVAFTVTVMAFALWWVQLRTDLGIAISEVRQHLLWLK